MSALLAQYLRDMLDASVCTHVIFVHDNCRSPMDQDDIRSAYSCPTTARELSRWDNSSSSLTNALAIPSPVMKRPVRNLGPPRRQTSFENLDDSDSFLELQHPRTHSDSQHIVPQILQTKHLDHQQDERAAILDCESCCSRRWRMI